MIVAQIIELLLALVVALLVAGVVCVLIAQAFADLHTRSSSTNRSGGR